MKHHLPSITRDLGIHYHVHSRSASGRAGQCLQHISADIVWENKRGQTMMKIGQISAYRLLRAAALKKKLDPVSIFCRQPQLRELGYGLYYYHGNTSYGTMIDAYRELAASGDLLVIQRIELLPYYRKSRIGRYVIRYVYRQFSEGCGLVALCCKPVQFETEPVDPYDEWHYAMGYHLIKEDEESSRASLLRHFTVLGFDHVPGISQDYLFVSTAREDARVHRSKFA